MDYQAELQNMPTPGTGCHPHLLKVANLGVRDGLTPEQVFQDIKAAIPQGGRRVPDSEILKTVEKAFREKSADWQSNNWQPFTPPPARRPRLDADGLRASIMALGTDNEADLWESSPVRLDGEPEADALLLLKHFYRPEEFLYLGSTFGKEVATAGEWVQLIKKHGTAQLPFIIPNVFDGNEHETASGTMSYRCDSAVAKFKFATVEFDNLGRADQLRFWSGVLKRNLLPVAALIDSANKSLHAWLKVDVADREAWDADVKERLFEKWLIPLGVDKSTKNPSRLSRLPGHLRAKTKRWQRILWLNRKES